MGNEELYEKIESYLSEQMPAEEAEAFRQELATNPELAAEVALHQSMAEAVNEDEEIEDLDHKISAILQKGKAKRPEVSPKSRFSFRPTFRLAAAIAILVIAAIATYFYLNQVDNSPQALYAQFIDNPSSIYEEQNLRSEDAPAIQPVLVQLDSLWKKADQEYGEEQYQDALDVLQQIEAIEVQLFQQASSRFYYYKGILLAKDEQFLAALTAFEQVRANYTEDANWKRAVILLRLAGRQEEALSMIREISTASTPRQADALRLLERLPSTK